MRLFLSASLILYVLLSCHNKNAFKTKKKAIDYCNNVEYKVGRFTIYNLPENKLPYIDGYGTMSPRPHMDADSVPLLEHQGRKIYHPVYLAQYALEMLDISTTTKDSSYLPEIIKIGNKLMDISIREGDVLWMPNSYDFNVHGFENENIVNPWYSAMSQGQVLSLMCRLYRLTNEEKYKEISHMLFRSLQTIKGKYNKRWTSCVDRNYNLWFEEFPHKVPFHTLNGMIFTLYGLYDYYLITENEDAKQLLQAGLLTIKNNIWRYRNKGESSSYCIKHNHIAADYHKIHIQQFKMLYSITHDEVFNKAQNKFSLDFKE